MPSASRTATPIDDEAPVEPAAEGDLDLGILPQLVGRQLRIAQVAAFRDFVMSSGGVSLTPGSFEVLELLAHNPGLSQSRLARAVALDKSSLVPVITRLEDLQLVRRKPSASDKRANELMITPKGRRALEGLREYVLERDARLTQGLSPAEAQLLNALLKKVAAACGG